MSHPPPEECCSILRFTEEAKSLLKKSSEFLGCEDAIVWPFKKLSKNLIALSTSESKTYCFRI